MPGEPAGCRERGDTAGTAFSLYLLGILAWQKGELAMVRSLMEEALELYQELNDKWNSGSQRT